MSAITDERKQELVEIATGYLNDQEFFEYHAWDGLIECEDVLTFEEFEWLRDNATVTVSVSAKEAE